MSKVEVTKLNQTPAQSVPPLMNGWPPNPPRNKYHFHTKCRMTTTCIVKRVKGQGHNVNTCYTWQMCTHMLMDVTRHKIEIWWKH